MFKKLSFLLILILILTLSTGVIAADYPSRKIELVVGAGEGGGTDTAARMVAEPLQDILGVPVIVVNKPGANAAIAENYVQDQPADGYTIIMGNTHISQNIVAGNVDHTLDDWEPIMRLQNDVGLIAVKSDGKFQTIDDFVNYAKENPGEAKIGVVMVVNQAVAEQFAREAGIDVNCIIYDGAGQSAKDLAAGNLDASHHEIHEIMGLVESGRLKPVLYLKDGDRVEAFPEVPTAGEKGWGATYLNPMRGVLVKKGISKEKIDILQKALKEVMETEKYKDYVKKNMLDIAEGYQGPEEYRKTLETLKEEFAKINYLFE